MKKSAIDEGCVGSKSIKNMTNFLTGAIIFIVNTSFQNKGFY